MQNNYFKNNNNNPTYLNQNILEAKKFYTLEGNLFCDILQKDDGFCKIKDI